MLEEAQIRRRADFLPLSDGRGDSGAKTTCRSSVSGSGTGRAGRPQASVPQYGGLAENRSDTSGVRLARPTWPPTEEHRRLGPC